MSSAADPQPEIPPTPLGSDRYFAWEHLLLLLTPFPVVFVAQLGYILGLSNNATDRILAFYITPVFFLSYMTLFAGPVVVGLVLVSLIVRNFWLKRAKRLVLYGVVLLALPLAMCFTDGDLLRFKLQQQKFNSLVAGAAVEKDTAICFVFDRVQDNFYLGGANFDPYEKLIIYVSEEAAGEENPRLGRFVASDCPPPETVTRIRQLSGRFYLGSTFHN
jgi:hypothetical protein